MAELLINGEPVIGEEGARLLDLLHTRGIKIPTMCYDTELGHFSSCMICAVKDNNSDRMIPACAARISDGMQIETDSDEVRAFRRDCLELLLSEHLGDCEGPCRIGCPAHMNIPAMIRLIKAGDLPAAIAVIKAHIALPAVLGRICSAPCEKVCRRDQAEGLGSTSQQVDKSTSPDSGPPNPVNPVIASKVPFPSDSPLPPDSGHKKSAATEDPRPLAARTCGLVDSWTSLPPAPVSICLLKRHVADTDLAQDTPYKPEIESIDKKAAVIGAGPAGLSGAYYLRRLGCDVTVYDRAETPGGSLLEVSPEELPPEVLEAEINQLKAIGISFNMKIAAVPEKLKADCDAVILAAGSDNPAPKELPAGIIAAGSCVRPMKMAVRACADGRRAAFEVYAFLTGEQHPEAGRRFNSRMGRLPEEALAVFMKHADEAARVMAAGDGFSPEEAVTEAGRCLNCDCRKADTCRLREYADEYGARASRFKGARGDTFRLQGNEAVISEPGKCIRCGLCVRITAAAKEEFGLSFKGRGFGTVIAVPFNEPMDRALAKTAQRCIEACPTGALSKPLDRGLQVHKLLGVPAAAAGGVSGSTGSQARKPEGSPE